MHLVHILCVPLSEEQIYSNRSISSDSQTQKQRGGAWWYNLKLVGKVHIYEKKRLPYLRAAIYGYIIYLRIYYIAKSHCSFNFLS